jgi:hypothetical protein
MDNELYGYSPIVSRPKLVWPKGARIAFYIGLNIEHYEVDWPSTSIFSLTASLKPDPLNYGWRDCAARVGIWRMIEALDRYQMRASVMLNADCCRHYPQIIDAGKERNWGLDCPRQEQTQFSKQIRRLSKSGAISLRSSKRFPKALEYITGQDGVRLTSIE